MQQTQSLIPLTQELVKTFIESSNPFPVDFEDAWQWAGYSRKDPAIRVLKTSFTESEDYVISHIKVENSKGRPIHEYKLTADCFKEFSMLAQTEQGKKVRLYFLNCEKELKLIRQNQIKAPTTLYEALMLAAETEKQKQLLLIENKKQSEYIEEHKPDIEFMSNLAQSEDRCSLTDVGRYLKQYGLGSNKISKWLFEKGCLTKRGKNYFTHSKYINCFQDVPSQKTYYDYNGYERRMVFNTIYVLPLGYKKIGSFMLQDTLISAKEWQQLSFYDILKDDQKQLMIV